VLALPRADRAPRRRASGAKNSRAWSIARALAARILAGDIELGNMTDGATSFHAADILPDWADQMDRTVQIGNHVFYRPLGRTQAS
jgi:N-acetylmuramoyl-L-alanine amidase